MYKLLNYYYFDSLSDYNIHDLWHDHRKRAFPSSQKSQNKPNVSQNILGSYFLK